MIRFKPLENHQIETITQMMQDFYAIDNYSIYLEVENHKQNAQKLYLANDFEVHNRKILKHKLF